MISPSSGAASFFAPHDALAALNSEEHENSVLEADQQHDRDNDQQRDQELIEAVEKDFDNSDLPTRAVTFQFPLPSSQFRVTY